VRVLLVQFLSVEIQASAKGDVLMTYDDTAEIRSLAMKYGFQFKRITMQTTHHKKGSSGNFWGFFPGDSYAGVRLAD
jgi:hypothetical protein